MFLKNKRINKYSIPDLSWIPGFDNLEFANYDLIEVSRSWKICSECAKYHGRVYSVSGNNKSFPKLPEYIITRVNEEHGCSFTFSPFQYGVSIMRNQDMVEVDPIEYSNRPFIDDRNEEEKRVYDEYITQKM